MKVITVFAALFAVASCAGPQGGSGSGTGRRDKCKCFPGDVCWPSTGEWNKFNATVGGRLIKTVPLGSPCHDPNYDAARCEVLKKEWQRAPIQ